MSEFAAVILRVGETVVDLPGWGWVFVLLVGVPFIPRS